MLVLREKLSPRSAIHVIVVIDVCSDGFMRVCELQQMMSLRGVDLGSLCGRSLADLCRSEDLGSSRWGCLGGSGTDPGPTGGDWVRSGVGSRSIVGGVGAVLWAIWGRRGVGLGSGVDSGSMWGRVGVDMQLIWGRSGVGVGSTCGRVEVYLKSICGRPRLHLACIQGSILRVSGADLESLCGSSVALPEAAGLSTDIVAAVGAFLVEPGAAALYARAPAVCGEVAAAGAAAPLASPQNRGGPTAGSLIAREILYAVCAELREAAWHSDARVASGWKRDAGTRMDAGLGKRLTSIRGR